MPVRITRVFAISLFACGLALGQQYQHPVAAPVDAAMRDYIMRHPEVILESLKGLQERQKQAALERTRQSVIASRAELVNDTATPWTGNPNGVTVVEFFDYRCGYCKKVHSTLAELLKSNSNVRVVFKELPILGPDSLLASKASLAAGRQGGYLKFHNTLLMASEPLTMQLIEQTAAAAGLDVEKLKTDMNRPEIGEAIARNGQLAERLGIRATPTFVVGSEVVSGAVDAEHLRKLVEAESVPISAGK